MVDDQAKQLCTLRGMMDFRSATKPVHSGTAGGMLADPVIALNAILSRLYWNHKKLPVPGIYDKVRKLTSAETRELRRQRAQHSVPFRVLAQNFGVSVWTAHRICRRRR